MARPDHRSNFIDQRLSPFLKAAHVQMLDAADLKGHSRVLVVECRDGWAAEEAWRRIRRGYVCGVDPSHSMITLARQYRGVDGRLEFLTWDRASLPFEDASFDILMVPFTLHRLPDPPTVLAEGARVLKSSGTLLVLESTKYSFGGLYLLVDLVNRLYDPGHVRYYSGRGLMSLIEDSGFQRPRRRARFSKLLSGGKVLANASLIEARVP